MVSLTCTLHLTARLKEAGCPYPVLSNVQTKKHPKWLCPPCTRARRLLLKYTAGDAKDKQAMLKMQLNNPTKFKKMVVSVRVRSSDEPPHVKGVGSKDDAQEALDNAAATIRQSVSNTLRVGKQQIGSWMTKKEFLAFQQFTKGETLTDSQNMWNDTLRDASTSSKTNGEGEIEVFVFAKPKLVLDLGRELKRDLRNKPLPVTDAATAAQLMDARSFDVKGMLSSSFSDLAPPQTFQRVDSAITDGPSGSFGDGSGAFSFLEAGSLLKVTDGHRTEGTGSESATPRKATDAASTVSDDFAESLAEEDGDRYVKT